MVRDGRDPGRLAATLMVQGTASHAGKSLLVAGLCRLFSQAGWRVAPFKAQNMALNSFVTPDGGEIGRAQALQAQAAGVPPAVEMNPVLLKPSGEMMAQVVVLGRPIGHFSAGAYRREVLPALRPVVRDALDRLRRSHDLVILEGAGSPAEVNLRDGDIVNMWAAAQADAPVVLVGDIDRGGVFASLVGTLELLRPDERRRVAGLVINKFRGDLALLEPGLEWLRARTGLPVLGVLPYLQGLVLEEEDSVALEASSAASGAAGTPAAGLDVAAVQFPRVSNFSDLDALAAEPGVRVRWVSRPEALGTPDAVILPGSKNTVEDLLALVESGLARAVRRLAEAGTPVVGLCGGYQMLGRELRDPDHVESAWDRVDGLGLLEVATVFAGSKTTHQVRAVVRGGEGLLAGAGGLEVEGYEIHMGRTSREAGTPAFATVTRRSGLPVAEPDGAVAPGGRVFGTYVHGLFDNDRFRRAWLEALWRARPGGMARSPGGPPQADGEDGATLPGLAARREASLDRLAEAIRRHLDVAALARLAGLPGTHRRWVRPGRRQRKEHPPSE